MHVISRYDFRVPLCAARVIVAFSLPILLSIALHVIVRLWNATFLPAFVAEYKCHNGAGWPVGKAESRRQAHLPASGQACITEQHDE